MITPEEHAAVSDAMHAAYRETPLQNGSYEAFPAGRAALRVKPAEVLFYAEDLAAEMEGEFR